MASTRNDTKHDSEKFGVDELKNSGQDSIAVASTYGIDEKHFLRKLDRILSPGVVALYLLSFLDRSNGKSLAVNVHRKQY